MNQQSEYLRNKVWYIINTIQANQLFVHSATLEVKYSDVLDTKQETEDDSKNKPKNRAKKAEKSKMITKKLPEILTICILNALVPNSAMLLIGGHGGGKTSIVKYLSRMFTGISLNEAEECILRAHPQLTEEKVIASLNFVKLMKDGKEEVNWRKFATSFWKIIDEVNRTSPYTQNILLSLLAEGKIKYYDAVMDVSKYCLYATLNPHDAGTFELSAPFLDRFGISVPISMPKSQDLATILSGHDEKLGGYDELVQVPKVLTIEQLMSIWYEVGSVPCSSDAEDLIHAIVREYTLCIRIDKGNSDYLKPSTGVCAGCHFNISEKIPCSNIDSILSVRVAKDLLRYSRALTWLLGLTRVETPIVIAIAPYIISHRAIYLERFINRDPYWGSKIEFTKNILNIILKRFDNRHLAYEIISKLRLGNGSPQDMTVLEEMAKNDVIVQQDLFPLAQTLLDSRYQEIIHQISEAEQKRDINTISQLRTNLLHDIDFPCRGDLITQLNLILRKLTESAYNCSIQVWDSIRFSIDGMFPEFSKILKETVKQRKTYLLRAEDLVLEINITGINPQDIVNFNFYGGESARKLKETIETRHGNALKSMEDLLIANEKSENELDQIKRNLEKKEKSNSLVDKLSEDLADMKEELSK